MRIASAILIAANAPASAAIAAPDVCYLGKPPTDAIKTERKGVHPLFAIDLGLFISNIRVICAVDIEEDRRFWHSMTDYYKCDATTPIRKAVDAALSGPIPGWTSGGDKLREEEPEKYSRFCNAVSDCKFSATYTPEIKSNFTCPPEISEFIR